MKKTLSGLVTAVLTAGTVLLPFSGFLGTAAVSADETYESAWFPLRTMALTQISFESYSHGSSYHIDCSGRYEQCAFAPFTGKVVYTTSNYGLVLFQSLSPVHYADGSLDYMTVVFMHADNTAELEKKRVSGEVIPQGKDFLRCGGVGKNGAVEYAVHYDIGVYKGQLNAPSGYYSRLGNIYPFDGFYLNPDMTPNIVNKGHLNSTNTLKSGSYNNWDDLWVTLPQPVDQPAEEQPSEQPQDDPNEQQNPSEETPAELVDTKPEQPIITVSAGSSAEPVTVSFQECANATYYNTRIYDSNHTVVYCVGLCSDAEPFGEVRVTDETTLTRQLPAGDYQVWVTAVNRDTAECTAATPVSFTVTKSAEDAEKELGEDIILLCSFLCGDAELTAEQAEHLDCNADGKLNAVDLTLWKRQAIPAAAAA